MDDTEIKTLKRTELRSGELRENPRALKRS
jgi:hypothetical protein